MVNSRAGIYAATADHSERKWLQIPVHTLRTHSGPFKVSMLKSIPVRCRFVDLNGNPVEGVRLAAYHHTRYCEPIFSDARGEASFFLYAEWKNLVTGICGIHEKHGYFVCDSDDAITKAIEDPAKPVVEFRQVKAKPRVVRVVDLSDKLIANVRLHIGIGLKNKRHAFASGIPAAEAVSDEKGDATFTWMPEEIEYFHPEIVGQDWKECGYLEHKDGGPQGIKVVPYSWVTGKLKGPPGVDLSGVCIAGTANHPEADSFALASCRCDSQGRFRLNAPADHVLTFEVQDQELVSDNATVLVPRDPQSAPPIELTAQTGRRLRIRFEGYAKSQSSLLPSVEIGRISQIIDPISGKKMQHSAFRSKSSSCDENGIADFMIFPGRYLIHCRRGDWRHEETVVVENEDAEVRIELPNMLAHKVQGRVIASKETLESLAGKLEVTARAIGNPEQTRHIYDESPSDKVVKAQVDRDGRFSLNMVGDFAQLYIKSTDGTWQTLQNVQWTDKPTEIPLHRAATFGGVLLDQKDQGLADTEIRIVGRTTYELLRLSIRTDAQGRFTAPPLPAETALTVIVDSRDVMFFKSFDDGESPTDFKISTRPVVRQQAPIDTAEALDARVKLLLRDAKLGAMGALVILEGDGEKIEPFVKQYVQDGDANASIYEFTPLRITQNMMKKPVLIDWMKEQLWTLPENEQFALLLLTADGRVSAQAAFPASPIPEIRTALADLLNKHAPPNRDALVELEAALAAAKREGKKLLVKHTGTRCYPCTLLARWLDDHKALLERDYIYFAFDDSRDDHGEELAKRIGAQGHGIPYFVIMNEQGEVEINSVGTLGNIGMASGREGKRHLSKMLTTTAKTLTEKEIESLIATLEDDE